MFDYKSAISIVERFELAVHLLSGQLASLNLHFIGIKQLHSVHSFSVELNRSQVLQISYLV
jgi:hypothetical protein